MLKGNGCILEKKLSDTLTALEHAKSFVSTVSTPQPKFSTPTRMGSIEKRTLRGGKKKEAAPGNTKILSLEDQDYNERWKDIKPEGNGVDSR
jgi:hypothetical protein